MSGMCSSLSFPKYSRYPVRHTPKHRLLCHDMATPQITDCCVMTCTHSQNTECHAMTCTHSKNTDCCAMTCTHSKNTDCCAVTCTHSKNTDCCAMTCTHSKNTDCCAMTCKYTDVAADGRALLLSIETCAKPSGWKEYLQGQGHVQSHERVIPHIHDLW